MSWFHISAWATSMTQTLMLCDAPFQLSLALGLALGSRVTAVSGQLDTVTYGTRRYRSSRTGLNRGTVMLGPRAGQLSPEFIQPRTTVYAHLIGARRRQDAGGGERHAISCRLTRARYGLAGAVRCGPLNGQYKLSRSDYLMHGGLDLLFPPALPQSGSILGRSLHEPSNGPLGLVIDVVINQ